MYYRIRKEWNEGKWDKSQKGAFMTYESALENYKPEYDDECYKIFSPTGDIVYPHHEVTQILLNDGLDVAALYLDRVFQENEDVKCDYVKKIIKDYSAKLNKSINPFTPITSLYEIIPYNGLTIYKTSPRNVKIKIADERKKEINDLFFVNGGFFAGYKESYENMMINFTLPVANIIADCELDNLHPVARKYWLERKFIDNKTYFTANDNGPQFKDKYVSTLVIYSDYSTEIKKINIFESKTIGDAKITNPIYAISGYPIILNKVKCTHSEALAEGWESGVTRATLHPFIGILDDNNIALFMMRTTQSGKAMIDEVYDIIKDFGFKSLIKLDGGGSAIHKMNNEIIDSTDENRRINSIITIG